MKHTKGKWEVSADGKRMQVEIVADNRRIAGVYYEGGSEDKEIYSNALLIASAPDLLEACEDAWLFIKLLNLDEEHHLNSMLPAAINKAKGVK